LIPATVVILLLLLALGLPVASVLAILGLTLGDVLAGLPLHRAMGEIAWSANSEVIIVAIPLFVLMGEILLRSGVAARMYDSAVQWMSCSCD
jgi:TRAP-type mannitol/chloroaromatic compound transport system permease large subunit